MIDHEWCPSARSEIARLVRAVRDAEAERDEKEAEVERLRAEVARLTPPLGMDAGAVVAWYLDVHGYDGLYQPGECSCDKGDLWPCGGNFEGCAPGVKWCPHHIGSRALAAIAGKDGGER
jgi:hypothetical protein